MKSIAIAPHPMRNNIKRNFQRNIQRNFQLKEALTLPHERFEIASLCVTAQQNQFQITELQ